MDWTELVLQVQRPCADTAIAIATALCEGGLYIEDYEDLEEKVREIAHVDLIEQELLDRPRDVVKIHLYVSPEDNAAALAETLAGRFLAAGVPYTLHTGSIKQQDWETAWKQYYHPIEIGARLAVAPSWEPYPGTGRTVLKLDPGMAFGTGTHETTHLCLQLLDERVHGGERMLDVGTGSGILAVAALLLGAQSALGVDIDPMAVRTAAENAALNGVQDRFEVQAGDLAQKAAGVFDIITANIVADAILRLAPAISPLLAPKGVFIASGIIDEKEQLVAHGLGEHGLKLVETRRMGGWVALVCGKDQAQ